MGSIAQLVSYILHVFTQQLLQVVSSVGELVHMMAEGDVVTRVVQEAIYLRKQFTRLSTEKVN